LQFLCEQYIRGAIPVFSAELLEAMHENRERLQREWMLLGVAQAKENSVELAAAISEYGTF